MRRAFSFKPLTNLGRIVYLRSPFQEAVPELAIKQFGSIAAAYKSGIMLFDLAAHDKDRLPVIDTDDGVILEKGISEIAEKLGIRADQFETYRHSKAFCLPPSKAVFYTELSHDQVYTSDALLARMADFLKSGCFADNAAVGSQKGLS